MSIDNQYGDSTVVPKPATASVGIAKSEPTHVVEVFIAGDIEHAKQLLRKFCKERPCCVTVTKTTYIYRGGEESGLVVGLRNYPRFPSERQSLLRTATDIGEMLLDALGQDSFMVTDHSGQTVWTTTRQGG